MPGNARIAVCLDLTRAISRTRTVEEIYGAALDALAQGLAVSRASILLFDPDGVMRFKAFRGLSDGYRKAVEGHTPWSPDTPDPQPIVVPDVREEPTLAPFLGTIQREGIAAMAFIPLVSLGRVIGKFMLYYDYPQALTANDLQLAGVIAAQVAFAVERTSAQEQARQSEERLRFALEAASMGTWDWDMVTNRVQWSENLERVHRLPPGTFDGSFASYEREIHPEDRERVLASVRRAVADGVPHDVEYRIVAPDGTVQWVEGKGRVEYQDGEPVRMTGVCMLATRRKEAELARIASAEEASRLKDEFLATLSHELRTPLNAVLGWVQLLEAEAVPPERLKQAITVIGRNARLQAQLIEDILDVSRIVAGKLDVEHLPVLLPALVDTAVSGILPAARAKSIQLTTEVDSHLPPVEGDPKRLLQVLGNVLSNAVKFTPEGGRVHTRCGLRDGSVIVEVQDSGCGIDRDFLPYVFDRFRQADCRTTRTHGGLGLGLAIARHLVEQHRGHIDVGSDGPGSGTTITISLPATLSSLEAADQAARRPAGEAARQLAAAHVLVVDDQRDSRDLLGAVLGQYGARVRSCGDVASALAVLAAEPVDLLLADIAMPQADGYDLIRRARQVRGDLPAIAVSAYARPEDRHRALAAGFNGYCSKPVDRDALLEAVAGVLPARSAVRS